MAPQSEASPAVPPIEPDKHGGSLLAATSNAMVAAMKQYYGKGPTKAKSYMVDNYLFVVMQGGFTVVEETLVRSGKHDLVREVRQIFQNEMAAEFIGQIEEVTGRKVLTYQSQIVFDPDTQFEIFVLDPAGDGTEEVEATAEAQSGEGGERMGESTQAVVGEARNAEESEGYTP